MRTEGDIRMNYSDLVEFIKSYDAEAGSVVEAEFDRQQYTIELIASENIASEAVMAATGSCLTNKYAEGYPGKRYYGGCHVVDEGELLAQKRACELFGCKYANVQPHSGSTANFEVYSALIKPGDKVMGMNLSDGGHLTHGSPANNSGKLYNIVSYSVDKDTEMLDYDAIEAMAKREMPKLIIAGASAYPRIIDFKRFREIADSVGAYLMVDMAHIAGLVAAGLHPSPVPYAHVVSTTTHKTLRGPRGGLILTNDEEIYKKINSAVFPGSQGGPLEHVVLAKAVCFGEALKDSFKEYQAQVLKNIKVLAATLVEEGFRLVSGGTDNHLILVDVRNFGVTGKELEKKLDEVGITVNKNGIPNDPEGPFITSGIRIGAPAVTTRGMKEEDMVEIGRCIGLAVKDFEKNKDEVRARTRALCEKYPIYR